MKQSPEMRLALALILTFSSAFNGVFFVSAYQSLIPFNLSDIALQPSHFSSSFSSSTPAFLQDVVKAIAAKEKWDPNGNVRVSELDHASPRVGDSQRYEVRMRVGGSVLALKFGYEMEDVKWRRWEGEFGVDLMDGVKSQRASVGGLEVEGPVEFHVGNGGVDNLSLLLPNNMTHKALRRVLVGDGITIRLEGAQEVSLVHPCSILLSLNGSLTIHSEAKHPFWPLGYTSCSPLLSIQVVGSASLHAFRTHNPKVSVKAAFRSHDTVELLPDKCYNHENLEHVATFSIKSLSSRLVLVEKVLRNFLGSEIFQRRSARILKVKVIALMLVKFQFELERDITENDKKWQKVEEWRTKPTAERQRFEVVARVEGKRLKPLTIKKLKRPLIAFDSMSWSNLMSNISFTELSSFVVPPEALTLDVKW
ncbi:hypothetical protein J5N97_028523 [Dioscorea zingiberensis]|uniref:Uncharacterized protein n=1 Tax=Dioscorea zingiberensis TaxID=325984 RepID=A0A9D5BZ84_9LILI|nr:hypothetical protein J5N97_028523 [Dioscorea zingiberensis]